MQFHRHDGLPVELGGQGMPLLMDTAVREHFIFNMAFNLYMEASVGAANLIAAHGSEAQKQTYMPQMYAGTWGGTMALTEPGAGTDVGALTTRAIKQADGTEKSSYLLMLYSDANLVKTMGFKLLSGNAPEQLQKQ